MSIAKYVKGYTVVHNLNAITKIIFVTVYSLSTVFLTNLYSLIAMLAIILIVWTLARLSFSRAKGILMLTVGSMIFMIIVQGFLYWRGETPLFTLPFFKWGEKWGERGGIAPGTFTLEGVIYGFTMALKVPIVVFLFLTLTLTTPLTQIIIALVKLKVPYTIAFTLSSALRFTPYVYSTFDNIKIAQKLRAFDRKKLGRIARFKEGFIPLLVPLFMSLFRATDMLTMAVESRAFGAPVKRTYVEEVKMKRLDYIFLGVTMGAIAAILVYNIYMGTISLTLGYYE